MMYTNVATGEIWSEYEIRESYDDFRDQSVYMSQFESCDDYIYDQIMKGNLEPFE